MSDWARRFAEVKNTLSIFILSMCRIEVDTAAKEKVYGKSYLKEPYSEKDEYRHLLNDC